MRRTKVLIVDSSSIVRNQFAKTLASDREIEVIGTAPDAYVARELIVQLRPDVITLDIDLPRMDGLSFLSKLMRHFPVPTVIVGKFSANGPELALRALASGAADFIEKPAVESEQSLSKISGELIRKVKAASQGNVKALPKRVPVAEGLAKIIAGNAKVTTSASAQENSHGQQIIAIASSTGGTEALKHVLPLLPAESPGIVIVQHMPPVFTKLYAQSLNQMCKVEVKEAQDGDRVQPGQVLLAPGDYHMTLVKSGAQYSVKLNQEQSLWGVRPAADFLLKSVAKLAGANAIGLVLTGMGRDGADGLMKMKQAGAYTIAQNEESSVVFGMPKAAIDAGAINKVLPLDQIPAELIKRYKFKAAA